MWMHDLEQWTRRDPAGRGLLARPDRASRWCPGHLERAAHELAHDAKGVAIVTGFFIPDADPPAAETDGLVGSVLLADQLASLGLDVCLLTDSSCAHALQTAREAAGVPEVDVLSCPVPPERSEPWCTEFWHSDRGERLTHLVAIERVGPAHSQETFATQPDVTDADRELFRRIVPPDSEGRCHNMRGQVIDPWTAGLHRLFENRAGRNGQPRVRTIGIGDGGNELGMGALPWRELVESLPDPTLGRTVCRTAADLLLLAGTSDWGAFALASAVALKRQQLSTLARWTAARVEQTLIQTVRLGPAVDGITRRAEPTVDGLPLITYLQPWLHIRRELGLSG